MDEKLRSLYRSLETNDLDALPAIVVMLTRLGHSISEIFDLLNSKIAISLEVIWDCLKGQEPGNTSELLLAIDEEIQTRGWVTNRPLRHAEIPGFRHSGVIGFNNNFNRFPTPFLRTIWSRSLDIPNVRDGAGLFLEDEPTFHPIPVIALSEIEVRGGSTFTLRVPIILESHKKSLDIVAELARRTQAGDIEACGFSLYKEF